ncbi:MAG: dihydropteroate synthase, partial [Acidobacteria bacterium]|nr:dihydropteroate synthase [Acidobacteriota bacterium]
MLTLNDLRRLAEAHPEALEATVPGFDIGGRPFDFDQRPAIMGVVNMSRDSWYRESVVPTPEAAIRRGRV